MGLNELHPVDRSQQACKEGDEFDVKKKKIMKAEKALVNMSDSLGMTPLLTAAKAKQVDLCKLMLEKGADPEAVRVTLSDNPGRQLLTGAAHLCRKTRRAQTRSSWSAKATWSSQRCYRPRLTTQEAVVSCLTELAYKHVFRSVASSLLIRFLSAARANLTYPFAPVPSGQGKKKKK